MILCLVFTAHPPCGLGVGVAIARFRGPGPKLESYEHLWSTTVGAQHLFSAA